MKKHIFLIWAMMGCFLFLNAYAQRTPFAILEAALAQSDTSTEAFTSEEAQNVIREMENDGYPVSDEAVSGNDDEYYKYDFSMQLLEERLGEYHSWSIEDKHRFDQMMVAAGQLAYCYNLLPGKGEITQAEALELAFSAIQSRYGVEVIDHDDTTSIQASYCLVNTSSSKGMWRFGILPANQKLYEVEVMDAQVTRCYERVMLSELEDEYTALCDEKGAFFQWSLWDKMCFADSLPNKLAKAGKEQTLLPSGIELEAISTYGFCMPTGDALSQAEALQIAIQATSDTFGLSDGWETNAEVYYSFFSRQEQEYTWRVIFWKVGHEKYPSGLVDINAETGEIIRVEKNGLKPNDYIPYIERL